RASRSPFSVSYRMGSPDDTTRLVRGGRYLVEFNASAISDVNGNPLLWGNEVNDGSIANLYFGFLMEPEAGEDIVPPRVQNVSISQFENNWRAVATFNEVMDTTTFNSDNFALFDGDKIRLDGSFIKQSGMRIFEFYPSSRTIQPVYYYITTAVTDSVGNMLDGNGDGRGGEDEDFYTNLPDGP
ncbi:MAG: hypothetical protein GY839_17855, partial [candidate division Zixibacteria bacterium]|nr:hypothetical protein [candidate division Zixibacteria bacterium]